MSHLTQKRILIIDDNAEIHKDFHNILTVNHDDVDLASLEAELLGKDDQKVEHLEYQIDFAFQGQEALGLVEKALASGSPYALAFVDIRMPPGWDGIETIKQLWKVDPNMQMVICSAYSDHSWNDITRELGYSDNLVILKKPFEVIEISQLAAALTRKWELISNLNMLVQDRTSELESVYALTKATLESTQEGILAIGKNQITFNEKFIQMWKLSPDVLRTETPAEVFVQLAEEVEDSVLFLKVMNNLSQQPQSKEIREWKLHNGRTFELFAHPQYLQNEVCGVVFSFRDITERKKLEEQLLHQATHDVLTGLPNRSLLSDRIKQAIAHAKCYGLFVGVLLLDLDNFKQINDSLGHNAGDLLLQQKAEKLLEVVREGDTVARLGGDEFVVILASQAHEESLVTQVGKFIEMFLAPCKLENHEVTVTVSIGVSIYPKDGQDADTLLKNADAALYHAKEIGRNCFQFYRKEFNEHVLQHAELASAMRQAVERKEFILNYQPLVDLRTNHLIGMEALLRWQHPTMGLISPMTFIPLAEESGVIVEIGEWVLRTACQQAKLWQQSSNFPKLRMAVNISVRQFRQKNFVELVQNILKETELDPDTLELEITESHILQNVGEIIEIMLALKDLGVHLAIDDFGTGYSSLSYLKRFPFDKVKIDKSFIDNIAEDGTNASIVEAIIGMTKHMGIEVLAEGVENSGQVAFLRKHHSDQVQGYYFSKPLDEKACTKLLAKKEVFEGDE